MIFDGKAFAREIESQVKESVKKLGRVPVVTSILVGDDPASTLYTSLKQKAAERCGIIYEVEKLASAEGIKNAITECESDGIMIQLPIPTLQGETLKGVIEQIPLNKDVDGLRWEESGIMPATVRAILSILDKIAVASDMYHVTRFWEKKFLIVGGTGAVGRPLVKYLQSNYGVSAEIANSKTVDLQGETLKAEVIISCVGRAGLITKEMINEYDPSTGSGQIVIDVGISKHEGKVAGDMEREVYEKAKIAVPVPGGVGPVTVASLMKNALDLAR